MTSGSPPVISTPPSGLVISIAFAMPGFFVRLYVMCRASSSP